MRPIVLLSLLSTACSFDYSKLRGAYDGSSDSGGSGGLGGSGTAGTTGATGGAGARGGAGGSGGHGGRAGTGVGGTVGRGGASGNAGAGVGGGGQVGTGGSGTAGATGLAGSGGAGGACVDTSCTPYICGTSACKTTCATNADCISAAYMCSGGSCIQAVNITVETEMVNGSNKDFIYFNVRIINNGTTAIPLSQITVKYWYTWDVSADAGTQPNETAACSYTLGAAPGNCGNVTMSFGTVSPALTGADHSLQFGFTPAAGSLAAGATAEFGPGFNKNDFSSFDQTNDYSYNSSTTFTTVTNVTVYLDGMLVYGIEP